MEQILCHPWMDEVIDEEEEDHDVIIEIDEKALEAEQQEEEEEEDTVLCIDEPSGLVHSHTPQQPTATVGGV